MLCVKIYERLIEINHPVMSRAGLEILDLLAHAAVVREERVLGRKFSVGIGTALLRFGRDHHGFADFFIGIGALPGDGPDGN